MGREEENQGKCFLCGAKCKVIPIHDYGHIEFDCRYCGYFVITDNLSLEGIPEDEKIRMKALAMERKLQGKDRFVLSDEGTSQLVHKMPVFTIDQFLENYPEGPLETLDRSLLNLSRKVKHVGDEVNINTEIEYAYLFSSTFTQAKNVANELKNLGYITFGQETKSSKVKIGRRGRINDIRIRTKGWERIDKLKTQPPGNKLQAFVAMRIHESTDEIYNAIEKAVEADEVTKCFRIDLKEHNNKICDEIIAEIRRSKYMVADFTGNRQNVYFEAGFAQGLGIPVIFIVPKEHLKNTHFDTRQYNHIIYEDATDLEKRLLHRIRATIG